MCDNCTALEQQLVEARANLDKEIDNAIADKKLAFKLAEERDSLREQLRAAEEQIATFPGILRALNRAVGRADKAEAEAFNLNGALINAEERIKELEAALAEANRQRDRLSTTLRSLLPRIGHPVQCVTMNPTDQWAEKGPQCFDTCQCGIKDAEQLLAGQPAQSHGTFAEGLEAAADFCERYFKAGSSVTPVLFYSIRAIQPAAKERE